MQTEKATDKRDLPHKYELAKDLPADAMAVCWCGRPFATPVHQARPEVASTYELPRELGS